VVVKHEDGVFGFLEQPRILALGLDNDLGNAVASLGCTSRVSSYHFVLQFYVRLFVFVLLNFAQRFAENQHTNVGFVPVEVRHNPSNLVAGSFGVRIQQDFV